jgi:hypothetical protein
MEFYCFCGSNVAGKIFHRREKMRVDKPGFSAKIWKTFFPDQQFVFITALKPLTNGIVIGLGLFI